MFKFIHLTIGVVFFSLSANLHAANLSIVPPSSLTLDGSSIIAGEFNLTGASGFSMPNGSLTETNFLNFSDSSDDIIISATIGSGTPHTLFDVPSEIGILHLEGFFNASDPDLPNAVFDILVGELINTSTDAFTYFLPTLTSNFFYQVTNLGSNLSSETDNTNTFWGGVHPVIATSATDPSLAGLNVLTLDNGVNEPWYVGVQGSQGNSSNCPTVSAHGSSTSGGTTGQCSSVSVPEPNSISLILSGLLFGGLKVYKAKKS